MANLIINGINDTDTVKRDKKYLAILGIKSDDDGVYSVTPCSMSTRVGSTLVFDVKYLGKGTGVSGVTLGEGYGISDLTIAATSGVVDGTSVTFDTVGTSTVTATFKINNVKKTEKCTITVTDDMRVNGSVNPTDTYEKDLDEDGSADPSTPSKPGTGSDTDHGESGTDVPKQVTKTFTMTSNKIATNALPTTISFTTNIDLNDIEVSANPDNQLTLNLNNKQISGTQSGPVTFTLTHKSQSKTIGSFTCYKDPSNAKNGTPISYNVVVNA